jgi:hypothetical protein
VQLPIAKLHKNTTSVSGIIYARLADRQAGKQRGTEILQERVILPRFIANPQQKYEIGFFKRGPQWGLLLHVLNLQKYKPVGNSRL